MCVISLLLAACFSRHPLSPVYCQLSYLFYFFLLMNMFVYERRATGGPVCPLCLSMCFISLLLPACFLDRYFDLFIVKPYLFYFFLLINMFVYERRATGGLVCPHPLSLQSGTWKIKLIPFNRDSLLLFVGFDWEKNVVYWSHLCLSSHGEGFTPLSLPSPQGFGPLGSRGSRTS